MMMLCLGNIDKSLCVPAAPHRRLVCAKRNRGCRVRKYCLCTIICSITTNLVAKITWKTQRNAKQKKTLPERTFFDSSFSGAHTIKVQNTTKAVCLAISSVRRRRRQRSNNNRWVAPHGCSMTFSLFPGKSHARSHTRNKRHSTRSMEI